MSNLVLFIIGLGIGSVTMALIATATWQIKLMADRDSPSRRQREYQRLPVRNY